MTTKHTPGPWKAGRYPAIDSGDKAWKVTDSTFLVNVARCDQSEANARLIASAPELLEALRIASGILGDVVTHPGSEFQRREIKFALQSVSAAIAKAIDTQ